MKTTSSIIYLASVLSLLTACGDKIKPGEYEVSRPVVKDVTISTVSRSVMKDYYETSGSIRAKNTSMVSAKVMGTVKDIRVRTGQKVKKGDLLLIIHSPDIQAKVRVAVEAVEESRRAMAVAGENKNLMIKTFERFKKLYEGKAITEQEFDQVNTKKTVALHQYKMAKNSLQKARASLKEARANRGYSYIRSPVDGVVAEKKIDVGSMANPGDPLFIIEEPEFRVEVPVDESLLKRISPGMVVKLYIDSLQLRTSGKVDEIVRQIDPRTRTFTVKVVPDEKNPEYRGGIYCNVSFPVSEKSGIFISDKTIINRGNLTGVYVVDDRGVITLRLVRPGKTFENKVEILSGLEEGEKIIVAGMENAVDGGILKGESLQK